MSALAVHFPYHLSPADDVQADIDMMRRIVELGQANLVRQERMVKAMRHEGTSSAASENLLRHCVQMLDAQKAYLKQLEKRNGTTLKDLRAKVADDYERTHPKISLVISDP